MVTGNFRLVPESLCDSQRAIYSLLTFYSTSFLSNQYDFPVSTGILAAYFVEK